MTRITRLFAALGISFLAVAGFAQAEPVSYDLPEETAVLRPGPGMDAAQSNCVACHSADYIAMQPPKRGKAFWDAEVTKMIKTYGAPITEPDAKVIADYLAQTY
ncbi:MAG: sulfite dehydrogenase (cytochrome) subunit [Methylobacteriaceae bacterium]|jgi:mono/diheme cytochrome c family protein|nr:sulfite dehydrogenase (cytochrome) subunit [Methylobacteriaceae bacterium]